MALRLWLRKPALLNYSYFFPIRNATTLSDFEILFKFNRSAIEKISGIPKAKYGGRHIVTMLPGYGIGPELMVCVKEIFRYAGCPVDFEEVHIGPEAWRIEELEDAVTSIRRNGVALKGNVEIGCLKRGVLSVVLRKELDLYVNVLNCKSYPGIVARHEDIDIVIIKQNTVGEYAMIEHEIVDGVVENLKVVTAEDSERVIRYAFEYAMQEGRKKVTTIHKANIMKLSDGLFLKTSRKIAEDYPEIEHSDMIVDNCCMQLVSQPHQFDVMVTTNLYGTIVSNVVCGLVGGPGLLSGINYGDQCAIFEPGTRSTGTAIEGQNTANPIAMLNAAVDMLCHLGYLYHAKIIQEAMDKTMNEDKIHTPDIGGESTTSDIAENIIKHLKKKTRKHNWRGVQPQCE